MLIGHMNLLQQKVKIMNRTKIRHHLNRAKFKKKNPISQPFFYQRFFNIFIPLNDKKKSFSVHDFKVRL